jgi:hypothetical protein
MPRAICKRRSCSPLYVPSPPTLPAPPSPLLFAMHMQSWSLALTLPLFSALLLSTPLICVLLLAYLLPHSAMPAV